MFNKQLNRNLAGLTAACAAITFGVAASAEASLIAHESFEGYAPGSIEGQGPAKLGFTGNWAISGVNQAILVPGLEFGPNYTGGQALYVERTNSGGGGRATREITASITPGNTYWTGFLGQFVVATGRTTGADWEFDARFATSNTGANSHGRSMVRQNGGNGLAALATGGATAGQATPGLTGPTNGTAAANYTPQTFLFVTKLNVETGGNNSSGTMWVFDLDGYNDLVAAGLTEANLSANAYAQTSIVLGLWQFPDNRWLGFSAFGGAAGIVDEWRLGTTLDSVVLIPEPASLALLGLGTALILGRRRH
jgi:hypothetical protein